MYLFHCLASLTGEIDSNEWCFLLSKVHRYWGASISKVSPAGSQLMKISRTGTERKIVTKEFSFILQYIHINFFKKKKKNHSMILLRLIPLALLRWVPLLPLCCVAEHGELPLLWVISYCCLPPPHSSNACWTVLIHGLFCSRGSFCIYFFPSIHFL